MFSTASTKSFGYANSLEIFHQPTFRSVDEAIRRRIVLIPFTVTIPPEKLDLNLEEKLKGEWSGILSWMLDGCLEWQDNGLMIPEVISKASDDYMEAEDTVGQFLEECTIQEGRILYRDLFHKFNGWQKGLGVSNTCTQTAMTRAIKERGYEEFRKNGGRGFIGLRLREADRYPNKRTDDF